MWPSRDGTGRYEDMHLPAQDCVTGGQWARWWHRTRWWHHEHLVIPWTPGDTMNTWWHHEHLVIPWTLGDIINTVTSTLGDIMNNWWHHQHLVTSTPGDIINTWWHDHHLVTLWCTYTCRTSNTANKALFIRGWVISLDIDNMVGPLIKPMNSWQLMTWTALWYTSSPAYVMRLLVISSDIFWQLVTHDITGAEDNSQDIRRHNRAHCDIFGPMTSWSTHGHHATSDFNTWRHPEHLPTSGAQFTTWFFF